MSRDRRRACLVVLPDRITSTIASARGESTTASVTDKVGGVSRTMWSYFSRVSALTTLMLEEESNSAGVGGGVPAGKTSRLGRVGATVIACFRVTLPVSTLLKPLR